MSKPVSFVVVGAGGRGQLFSRWLKDHPQYGHVVAVAEPDAKRRTQIAELFDLPADRVFADWKPLLDCGRIADAMINTTMDQLHAPTAIPALDLGYHMLLEKPMATTIEECIAIDDAQRRNNRIVSVCHSMRYRAVCVEVKRMLDAGAIGRLLSVDLLEPVGPVHQSHSFVRGNWGNEGRSTFMLMAKSCHDIDLIASFIGKPCKRVSSFGSLSYFTPAHAPQGATLRCTDGCPAEADCTYSALKIYAGDSDAAWWVAHAGFADMPREQRVEKLKTSPYGRCVYRTDNDVVDHQVVAFEFGDDITATFTMTAFAKGDRQIRMHGTAGELRANVENNTIDLHRFADGHKHHIVIPAQSGGHGGADSNLIRQFATAVRENDPSLITTGTEASLASHRIVFAAEQSRRENRMVSLDESWLASAVATGA